MSQKRSKRIRQLENELAACNVLAAKLFLRNILKNITFAQCVELK